MHVFTCLRHTHFHDVLGLNGILYLTFGELVDLFSIAATILDAHEQHMSIPASLYPVLSLSC